MIKLGERRNQAWKYGLGFLAVLLLTVHIFCALGYSDDSPESVFKTANQFYAKGLFDDAIRGYTSLLGRGIESGNLYFNLGNCYFRKGEPGRAILFYERARRLIPSDSELKANYNFAVSKIESTPGAAAVQIKDRIADLFSGLTLNSLTMFVSVVYAAIMLLSAALIFFRPTERYWTIAVVVLIIALAAGAFSLYARVSMHDREAIIVSKSAEAKFEPMDTATTHYTLYEGMKVQIIEAKAQWTKVERVDGKTGWIRSVAMEKI